LLSLLIWLKPRGLDRLLEIISPPAAREFDAFCLDSIKKRIALYKEQVALSENERRQDMLYYLCRAVDVGTDHQIYTQDELKAEANMLIIAASDTTAAALAGIFFYLTGSPNAYTKLANELLKTFKSAEDIVYGPTLMNCVYLRACIDEAMRLVPAGPCEPPREVLSGGLLINGDYYPEGTVIGTSLWCDGHNEQVYGDAGVFRPERWIVDEATGVTKQMVADIRANFHPFLSGPYGCAGKMVAIVEIMLTVARTLYRLDIRRAPGSTLGGGGPQMGWGAKDDKQFQVVDAFISLKHGPELQVRKRDYFGTTPV
jgi:cytochrome P450